jgi:DNA-binding Lrp family transcriptional regulator
MKHWECNECEYQCQGETAPAACPLCGEPGENFTETHPIEMDRLDKKLLNALQGAFPLTERPFAALGAELDLAEEDVIARIRRMKAAAIRQISAIFDSRSLGYRSTLVAFEFDPQEIDRGAAIINRHPGVSHNYRRNHRFNLWFTLTIHNSLRLEDEVNRLARDSGAKQSILLPTLRLFKIGVKLDATGEQEVTRKEQGPIVKGFREAQTLTEREIRAVRALQRDLPLVERPFRQLAEKHGEGLTQEDLFALAEDFRQRGIMRRYSAVLRHRNAGFSANAMGVWVVPEERLEEVGSLIADFAAVSHCYQRPSYPPDWPYNLFSMVHGKTVEDCDAVLDAISRETGITEYAKLYSTKEYKKVRVKYFTEATAKV